MSAHRSSTADKVVGVILRALSPRLAWALVVGLVLIALAVVVTGSLSAEPPPAPHVWHAHLLPALARPQQPPTKSPKSP
jgi:hypothetical protein